MAGNIVTTEGQKLNATITSGPVPAGPGANYAIANFNTTDTNANISVFAVGGSDTGGGKVKIGVLNTETSLTADAIVDIRTVTGGAAGTGGKPYVTWVNSMAGSDWYMGMISDSTDLIIGRVILTEPALRMTTAGAVTVSNAYTLPTADGNAGEVLQTDGAGAVTWAVEESSGEVVQQVYNSNANVVTVSTVCPYDDSIPQAAETDAVVSVAITPTNSSNILVIEYCFSGTSSSSADVTSCLFQDATANALFASVHQAGNGVNGDQTLVSQFYRMVAGTTSSTTLALKCGVNANTFYVNGEAAGNRRFGGVSIAQIKVTEFKV